MNDLSKLITNLEGGIGWLKPSTVRTQKSYLILLTDLLSISLSGTPKEINGLRERVKMSSTAFDGMKY